MMKFVLQLKLKISGMDLAVGKYLHIFWVLFNYAYAGIQGSSGVCNNL